MGGSGRLASSGPPLIGSSTFRCVLLPRDALHSRPSAVRLPSLRTLAELRIGASDPAVLLVLVGGRREVSRRVDLVVVLRRVLRSLFGPGCVLSQELDVRLSFL